MHGPPSRPRHFVFGRFRFETDPPRLFDKEDVLVAAPMKALETLRALIEHRERIVTKDELMALVWPDAIVEEANLSQQIYMLRKLLGDEAARPVYIATLARRGFRFVGEVVEVAPSLAPPPAQPEATDSPAPPVDPSPDPLPQWVWRIAAVALGVAVIDLVIRLSSGSPPQERTVTFELAMPASVTARPNLGLAGFSPDGRLIAVIAEQAGQAPAIWIRDVAGGDAIPVPGSAGAVQPFWSPDSRSLGFFQDGYLRVIPVSGGPPRDLCAASAPRGGTWNKDGTIVFGAGTRSPLFVIPASGGTPSAITSLDPAHRDVSHRFPNFLPDGRHFVFLVWAGDVEREGIYMGSLDGGPPVRLLRDLSPAIWSAGDLFFVRRETLMAQAMAATRLTGEARVVATPVGRDPSDFVAFAASSSGDLVFQRGQELTQLVWFDRTGRRLGNFGPPAHWADPAISRGGDRVAFVHRDRAAGNENLDVWTETLANNTRTQVTFDPAIDVLPVFSDDGRELIFRSNRSGFSDLYRKRLDAAAHESILLASNTRKDPTDWSRDGRSILVTETTPGGRQEIWLHDVERRRPPHAVVKEPVPAVDGRFSPDGRYIAFELRSGRSEVYVQALDDDGQRRRVSTDGGREPAWRADGRELFFVSGDHITAVDVSPAADGLKFGAPHALFDTAMFVGLRNGMAVSPDGQRFLISVPVPDAHPIEVVLHWQGRAVGREQR